MPVAGRSVFFQVGGVRFSVSLRIVGRHVVLQTLDAGAPAFLATWEGKDVPEAQAKFRLFREGETLDRAAIEAAGFTLAVS